MNSVNLAFELKENCHFLSLLEFNISECNIELIKVPTESATSFYTKDLKEMLLVVEGTGGVVIDGKSSLIKAGDIIHIPSNSIRSLSNIDNQYLQVISIKSI